MWLAIAPAEANEVPSLPETAKFFAISRCIDEDTKQMLTCHIYRDDRQTYAVLFDYKREVVRITWKEGLRPPVSIWVRFTHDTY